MKTAPTLYVYAVFCSMQLPEGKFVARLTETNVTRALAAAKQYSRLPMVQRIQKVPT